MWTDNADHDRDRDRDGHSCHDYVGLAQARPNEQLSTTVKQLTLYRPYETTKTSDMQGIVGASLSEYT